jgi:hypothetical protein
MLERLISSCCTYAHLRQIIPGWCIMHPENPGKFDVNLTRWSGLR